MEDIHETNKLLKQLRGFGLAAGAALKFLNVQNKDVFVFPDVSLYRTGMKNR